MNIEIISGSPRQNSVTQRVALHLHDLMAMEQRLSVGLIDMRDNHLPPVQNVWRSPADAPLGLKDVATRVFEAHAFILVSPEYNGLFSPSMKNFLDHFPHHARKVFGIVTASPGALGGIRAAVQLQNLIFGLSGIGVPKMLTVPEVEKRFDENGNLLDRDFKRAVDSFKDEFLWLSGAVYHAGLLQRNRLAV